MPDRVGRAVLPDSPVMAADGGDTVDRGTVDMAARISSGHRGVGRAPSTDEGVPAYLLLQAGLENVTEDIGALRQDMKAHERALEEAQRKRSVESHHEVAHLSATLEVAVKAVSRIERSVASIVETVNGGMNRPGMLEQMRTMDVRLQRIERRDEWLAKTALGAFITAVITAVTGVIVAAVFVTRNVSAAPPPPQSALSTPVSASADAGEEATP